MFENRFNPKMMLWFPQYDFIYTPLVKIHSLLTPLLSFTSTIVHNFFIWKLSHLNLPVLYLLTTSLKELASDEAPDIST